ncbi:hypothetical protein EI94DRAFT_1252083 [Lactarius quietus]|nr:hypothetical protein EI94DRAFT_1252083 [Lactarius quietus]
MAVTQCQSTGTATEIREARHTVHRRSPTPQPGGCSKHRTPQDDRADGAQRRDPKTSKGQDSDLRELLRHGVVVLTNARRSSQTRRTVCVQYVRSMLSTVTFRSAEKGALHCDEFCQVPYAIMIRYTGHRFGLGRNRIRNHEDVLSQIPERGIGLLGHQGCRDGWIDLSSTSGPRVSKMG